MTIPTAIGVNDYLNKPTFKATGLEDLDFHVGHDALANSATYSVSYPVRHGMVSLTFKNLWASSPAVNTRVCLRSQVDNWDHMERFYQHCIFKSGFSCCIVLNSLD